MFSKKTNFEKKLYLKCKTAFNLFTPSKIKPNIFNDKSMVYTKSHFRAFTQPIK